MTDSDRWLELKAGCVDLIWCHKDFTSQLLLEHINGSH